MINHLASLKCQEHKIQIKKCYILIIMTLNATWWKERLRFGLWCLTPLSTILQSYRGDQFYWWRKPEYLKKTLACRKSMTNFSHKVVSVHLSWVGFKLTTLVLIDADCTGSCKFNYHTITTTMSHKREGDIYCICLSMI